MSIGLTNSGYVWSLLSISASAIVCTGYYLPYWLSGSTSFKNGEETLSVHFGCFRMCNYFSMAGGQAVYFGCGRFQNFDDIPSVWWRVCTITVGLGCALSTVVALITLPAWCIERLITQNVGRTLGLCQAFSAILISLGCILYPIGWDNKHVIEICGESAGPYLFGTCYVGWAFYVMLGGVCLLFFCASLATTSGKITN